MVLVTVIHDLPDAALDDGLGTLVAGEQRHIYPRALEVVVGAVEDGVQLRMADVHILGFQRLALPLPGHGVVVAADGHAVVPQRQYFILRADDAGPDLAVRVLGAHGREQRDAHKVFVPVDIIAAFHPRGPPFWAQRRCVLLLESYHRWRGNATANRTETGKARLKNSSLIKNLKRAYPHSLAFPYQGMGALVSYELLLFTK